MSSWTLTTVLAAVITGALLVVLTGHAVLSALEGPAGRTTARRRLARAAVPLAVCFVAIVVARLAIIFAERPGP